MKKLLINTMLMLTAMSAAAFTTTPTDDLHVWAEFPVIVADGETVNYIKVYQHDDNDIDYCAFNMIFDLPEGFSINKVKDGRREVNDIKLTERADVTHTIACNIVDGVELRIFCDSSENANLYKDDEAGNPLDHLFTVGLIAAPSLADGTYEVRLHTVKFCQSNADATVPATEPILFTIPVGDTSGIAEVSLDTLAGETCYDLKGLPIDPKNYKGIVVCKGHKYIIR